MNTILYGADPEIPAVYSKDGEMYVLPPVFFRKYLGVPYERNGKHPIFAKDDNFVLHEDGVAFELSVPPSEKWERVFWNIQSGYEALRNIIKSYGSGECEDAIPIPTTGYEVNRWLKEDQMFRMCNIFGCDPDTDAFNTSAQSRTIKADLHPERYFGGHIHISGHPIFAEEPVMAIRTLAITVGVAAIAFSPVPDLEKRRTFLYGKPGKYRIQKYGDGSIGVEYRTPSTTWTSDFSIAEQVFKWVEIAVSMMGTDLPEKIMAVQLEESKTAILSADIYLAKQLLANIESML